MTRPNLAVFLSSDLPYRVLAVVGGFALGGLVVGWLVQVFARLAFTQKVPPWPLWIIRTLGGVVSAWIVYLCLFAGGGSGLGGAGGWFGGSGKYAGTTDAPTKDGSKPAEKKVEPSPSREAAKDQARDKDKAIASPGETVRVEVLGDAALKALTKGSGFDANRRYRVEGRPGLLTLEQVEGLLRERRSGKPGLRLVVVVLYQDSPAVDLPVVRSLSDFAHDLGTKVNYSLPDSNAPVD